MRKFAPPLDKIARAGHSGILPRPLFALILIVPWSVAWATAVPELKPGAPEVTSQRSATAPVVDNGALLLRLQNDLAGAREELSKLPADNGVNTSPGNVGAEIELSSRRVLLQLLVNITELQITHLNDLQDQQARSVQLEKELADWTGFVEAPVSPFIKQEELRESIRVFIKNSANLQAWLSLVEKIAARRANAVEEMAVKLRQINEAMERASRDAALQNDLAGRRDLLLLQNRVALARVMTADIESRRIREELRETKIRSLLAERQLGGLPKPVAFSSADLKTILAKLDDERQRIGSEIVALMQAMEGFQRNREHRGSNTGPHPAAATGMPDQQDGMGREQSDTVQSFDMRLQVLNSIAEFLRLQGDLWEVRWRSTQFRDRAEATEAYARIAKERLELQTMVQYGEQERRSLLNRMTETIDDLEVPLTSQDWIEKARGSLLDQVSSLSRMLGTLEATEGLLDRWELDLDERFEARSLSDRISEFLQASADMATAFWQFELFATEDTIEVDGQKISGTRSVTVGKVLTALAILIIGYWIASRLASLAERISVRRAGIDASHARIARRWILFVEVMVLVAVSLAVVRIPLTIFAFMGGAVAIGAGFGMQNLLKNLISGLMLLLERPFRPGDLVDVGGIRGWVIDIGMRSSHIRDDNGIETLIPNSTFIEENVTNWTLSSQSVRISVKVGVAYGSPTHEVTEALLEVAERHGLIEQKPPPQVLLEDFASDALLFGLYVWVGLNPELEWRAVASDLRFMINKALATRGIVIAYPQRDVHLDTKQPLHVRMVADNEET